MFVRGGIALLVLVAIWFFCGCSALRPQQGGKASAVFGGADAPSSITTTGPENPKTPSTTTVEKTISREYAPQNNSVARPAAPAAGVQASTGILTGADGARAAPVLSSSSALIRETVVERATTQLGSSWEDKARELGVKLANMRGVMWAGVALLILGPIIGWKMGWFTNGCIAGIVGLVLIVLAQIVPGNEAWFGLGGLVLIPLVAFVYYRAHHDAHLGIIQDLSARLTTMGAQKTSERSGSG